ncbi:MULTISPECIES: hypothetical protein [unclassified Agromyces]|uniref:hypothetical protein n=1 Tax=unclassified Agromyces TaxID=2639701 RepID=UPI0030153C8D
MSTRTVRPIASAAACGTALAMLLAGCSSPRAESAAESPAPAAAAESPTPSTDATTCPNPHGGSCLGPLEAGEYETTTFDPTISYRVPEGWFNSEDLPGNFWLFLEEDAEVQSSARGGSYLGVYTNVHAAALDCGEGWEDGVGTTPADLVAWYQSMPGLTVSEPVPASVGGLDGLQVDLALEDGVEACDFGGNPGLPLIIGDGVSDLHHVILEDMDVRLVLLEWGEGNLTLEITNVREQRSAEEFRSQLQPIIDSLVFDVAP